MQKRHKDRYSYFNEQSITTKDYVIPFVEEFIQFDKDTRVLEIGCGEGGNLKPFVDLGCKTIGVDMSKGKIDNAKAFFKTHPNVANTQFILENIYDSKDLGQFDFIFMRDVLEHIHNQERFMEYVKRFLKPNGYLFLGFPPFQNPFGGHQQICKHKILASTPYYHNLPVPIYRWILRLFKEPEHQITNLLEVKETGISIERFNKILKQTNYKLNKKLFYFINPNYHVKFGLKPRKQLRLIHSIPYLRNYLITTNYFLLSLK